MASTYGKHNISLAAALNTVDKVGVVNLKFTLQISFLYFFFTFSDAVFQPVAVFWLV